MTKLLTVDDEPVTDEPDAMRLCAEELPVLAGCELVWGGGCFLGVGFLLLGLALGLLDAETFPLIAL